jgi:hypothetical protein
MTQKSLAAALGISEAAVSKYVRQGMPLDVEGATAWRRSHVNPYIRSTPRPAAPAARDDAARPTIDGITAQIVAGGVPPPADVFEAIVNECVVLRHDKALLIARTLGAAAHDALQAGQPIDDLFVALRALMREFPQELLKLPLFTAEVWQALVQAAKAKDAA